MPTIPRNAHHAIVQDVLPPKPLPVPEPAVVAIEEVIAGPEELRLLLDVNQTRRATGVLLAIVAMGLMLAAIWVYGVRGNPSNFGLAVFLLIAVQSLFFLLVRKQRKVYWATPPEKFVIAATRIAAIRNIKGARQPRFKIQIKETAWGMNYNFPVLSIVAEDSNQFWPRFLIITPDYSYWRVGFAFSRGGWKVLKTSDLRVSNFYTDVPAPLFNWGQKIVGRTWEHATRSGDRDYRFKSNHAINLVRRYGVEIKVADGSEWSFTSTEQGREIARSSLLDIISAAKATIGQPGSSLRK